MNTDLAAQRAMDRLASAGFKALGETDRILATVWLFTAGVSNHGFFGYYSSSRGDLAFFAPHALRLIFASEIAALVERANAVFGVDGPPQDRDLRRKQLHALPESARMLFSDLENAYFESEEDVDELLERYLSQRVALH